VFAKLAWTEIKLSLREPTVAVFALAFPLILLYLLLNSFGNQPDPDFKGVNSADFYVPAYAAGTIAAMGIIAIPVHLASYRERGVLRRLRASGIAPRSVLVAQILVASLLVGIATVVMLLLGSASFDLSTPESWPIFLTGLVLATAAFCALGVALATLLPSARAAQSIGLLLFFGMFFISGGGPPEPILPAGVVFVANALPMSYAVEALQSGWWDGNWHGSGIAVLFSLMVACSFVAVRGLREV
jgi:ABC-2 type transport system permease protein